MSVTRHAHVKRVRHAEEKHSTEKLNAPHVIQLDGGLERMKAYPDWKNGEVSHD